MHIKSSKISSTLSAQKSARAFPGRAAKLALLKQRASRKEALFQPTDHQMEGAALVGWLQKPNPLRLALLRLL